MNSLISNSLKMELIAAIELDKEECLLGVLNLKAIVHKRNGVVSNYSDAIKFSEFRILG